MNDDYVVENARVVYGNLSPKFNRAVAAEKYLVGKKLFKNETLQNTLKILNKELIVDEIPVEPSPAYRRKLALGLFYKVRTTNTVVYVHQ